MPATLVPHTAIPELAARVDSDMLRALRLLQKADFIVNSKGIHPKTADALRRLIDLGLADPAYEGEENGRPFMWVGNSNGSRVLAYLTGIRGGPYYELPSSELAAWLLAQGADRCWNIDGDPLLTGRLTVPCPASKLAAELLRINKPLLVQAKKEDTEAKGQVIGQDRIDSVVERFVSNGPLLQEEDVPGWATDRVLYLCWKESANGWLLIEDSETTEMLRAVDEAHGRDSARVKKE